MLCIWVEARVIVNRETFITGCAPNFSDIVSGLGMGVQIIIIRKCLVTDSAGSSMHHTVHYLQMAHQALMSWEDFVTDFTGIERGKVMISSQMYLHCFVAMEGFITQ